MVNKQVFLELFANFRRDTKYKYVVFALLLQDYMSKRMNKQSHSVDLSFKECHNCFEFTCESGDNFEGVNTRY